MKPLISIITPLYNGSVTIGECYRDILRQTYSNWEWIIADDGSTDNSLSIIKPWLSERIKLVKTSKPFGGPGGPRNLAIQHAQGEWIAMLDQDDLWTPEKLEKQIDFSKKHPNLVLICGNQRVIGSKNHKRKGDVIIRTNADSFPSAEDIFVSNPFLASTALFQRQACLDVGGFDEKKIAIGRDEWDLWIRLALKYPVAYMNETLGSYRWHEGNLSHSMDHDNSTDYIRNKLRPLIQKKVFVKTVAKDHYIKAKNALKNKNTLKFRNEILAAGELDIKFYLKGYFYWFQNLFSQKKNLN